MPYAYNVQGEVQSIPNYVTDIHYNAVGQMTSISYVNTTLSTLTYDRTRDLPRTLVTLTTGGQRLQDLTYTWDDVGNLVELNSAVLRKA